MSPKNGKYVPPITHKTMEERIRACTQAARTGLTVKNFLQVYILLRIISPALHLLLVLVQTLELAIRLPLLGFLAITFFPDLSQHGRRFIMHFHRQKFPNFWFIQEVLKNCYRN